MKPRILAGQLVDGDTHLCCAPLDLLSVLAEPVQTSVMLTLEGILQITSNAIQPWAVSWANPHVRHQQ
jgi:hypothetical protein